MTLPKSLVPPLRPVSPKARVITVIGMTLCVLLFFAMVIRGFYISREPVRFDVSQEALERAQLQGVSTNLDEMPPGYVTLSTHMRLVETLLDKRGGFLDNDPLPPGVWLDNIPSWEFGVLTQVRDFTLALRLELSRAHTQSPERPELNAAQARFAFSHEAWVLPSAEAEYREGLVQLEKYAQSLTKDSAGFTIRANALDGWLRKVERRLGGSSVQLRANAGTDRYNPNVMTSGQDQPGAVAQAPVPRGEIDDVFYEARGTAWAIYHLMKGIKHDYAPVLDQMLAMGAMNRALSNLYASLEPLNSPMVMNGRDFGATPNHSLVLAAYLANAHLAVSELRDLLSNA